MTIADAIPRLIALDGLELPDGRCFDVIHVGFGDGLIGHLTPGSCPAGLAYVHDPCAAFTFLLMDVVEAIRSDTVWSLHEWWWRAGYIYSSPLTQSACCPTRIEAVLDVAVPLMETYAKDKEALK